ncbi:hypothetical protein LTR17_017452 [Elasticomyces elasticus]|nr:hypothetical protein LTR17_017452 [Elasticomyces elasticus]
MEAGFESPLRFSPLPPDPDHLINLIPTVPPDDPEPGLHDPEGRERSAQPADATYHWLSSLSTQGEVSARTGVIRAGAVGVNG